MVLDSRSRTDSSESIDGNGTEPSSNGSHTNTNRINPTNSTPANPANKKKSIGQWWQALGLRTKTAVISVAAITIPLLALGGFTYYYVGQNIAESTKQKDIEVSSELAQRLAYFMRDRYGDIQTIAQLSFLTNTKVREALPITEQKAILDTYIKSYLVYDSIAVYRLDGSLIVDVSPEPPPANISKRAYFQEVLKTDKPYISQPEASVVTKKVSLFIAAPVKDVTTGKTIAVVRSRMQASALDEVFKDFSEGAQEYHVSESDGKFFLASEANKIGQDIKTEFPELNSLIASRQRGSVTANDRAANREQFAGYSPLPKLEGLPELKWDAVIAIDTDIALKPLQQLLLILLAATGGVAVLASVLAIAIAQRATKPIIDATQAVVELGKGNLETRLAVEGEDEMAQLGGNINLMAEQLQTFLALQEAQTKRSQIIAEISRLRKTEELEVPLCRFLNEICQDLKCDRVVVYQFINDDLGRNLGEIVAESETHSNLSSAKTAGLSDPCIPDELIEGYKQGRVVATRDVFNAGFAPAHLDLMRKLQIKSNLVVPVLITGKLDSLLIAHSCSQMRDWQDSEIQFMQDYAKDLGLALGGIALIQQERTNALKERNRSETIQRELITLLSDVEGAVSGDLTVRAQISAGEIGIVADFFNAIVESLRDVVRKVKDTTGLVSTSVNTNNEAIRKLAQESTLQTKQLDEALTSVEQMTDSIQQVASSAQQAATASNTAANTAKTGSVEIEQSVQSILQLRQTVDDTAKKVKRLGDASKQISKVVVLIDQIALKTNMLALNASVEAARAGEEGRSFAVVAAEVGALAAQSATATKEIARLVESIQQETSEVVQAMEASTVQVVEGTNRVEDARKSLNQIVIVSQQVNELFQTISIATTSQVQTSQSVRSLMAKLSTQSQMSSETSRNVAIALQETADVTSQLQESVETFKVE
ncbi:methyl-accepting chemotaxis protein [Pseudanabaena sp. lw0831]|uniref:methyl-accepting chemotaxis protein n=1 Tax=Pseudanabaena sp. lw0831 TaxID=1357935 RepID=UPI0019152D4C|nr:methyl-accepting chemotaxis protein [Pseudanabaena sp. lw0831]GBO53195.1 methyl-accepting chemotaxis protein [Pseudanabaena sp. lw0831]